MDAAPVLLLLLIPATAAVANRLVATARRRRRQAQSTDRARLGAALHAGSTPASAVSPVAETGPGGALGDLDVSVVGDLAGVGARVEAEHRLETRHAVDDLVRGDPLSVTPRHGEGQVILLDSTDPARPCQLRVGGVREADWQRFRQDVTGDGSELILVGAEDRGAEWRVRLVKVTRTGSGNIGCALNLRGEILALNKV